VVGRRGTLAVTRIGGHALPQSWASATRCSCCSVRRSKRGALYRASWGRWTLRHCETCLPSRSSFGQEVDGAASRKWRRRWPRRGWLGSTASVGSLGISYWANGWRPPDAVSAGFNDAVHDMGRRCGRGLCQGWCKTACQSARRERRWRAPWTSLSISSRKGSGLPLVVKRIESRDHALKLADLLPAFDGQVGEGSGDGVSPGSRYRRAGARMALSK